MAAKKYLDLAGFQKLWSKVSSTFVAKEEGKGLFSGKYEDLTGVPTKVSTFENDADYTTKTEVADVYATKVENAKTLTDANAYTDEMVGAIVGFDFQIVDALPDVSAGKKGVIYLIAAKEGDNVSADNNIYTEYIFITNAEGVGSYEMIGTTKMDLTGYLQEVDIVAITDEEIDAICVAPAVDTPVTPAKTSYTLSATGYTLDPATAELASGETVSVTATAESDGTTTVAITLTAQEDGSVTATTEDTGYTVNASTVDGAVTITIATV